MKSVSNALTSDVSGTKKAEYGRVREFPKLEMSGTSLSGIARFEIFGNRVWNFGCREFLGNFGNSKATFD